MPEGRAGRRFVDLAHPLHPGTPVWPGHPPVARDVVSDVTAGDASTVGLLHLGEHAGTHLDAPLHFVPGGTDVRDVLGPDPFRVLHVVRCGPEGVDAAAVRAHEDRHGRLHPGAALAVATGWDARWGATAFTAPWPVVRPDVADLLVQRGVDLLVVDTPSPDPDGPDVPVHRRLLGAGAAIGENLRALTTLPPVCELVAVALPVRGGSGAPWRPVAVVAPSAGEPAQARPLR